MAYIGSSIPIPLGQLGLRTDDPMTSLPPNALIKANNVSLYSGRIEKALGSSRYNSTVLPASVIAIHDWWPDPTTQRLIAVTTAGNVYRDTGTGTFGSATALNTYEVQKIAFSLVPDAGSVTFRFNGVDASAGLAVTGATTAAAVQANLRTIAALASCIVYGTTALGFKVVMVGTTGDQPMLTTSANTLTSSAVAVTLTFTEVFKGGAVLGTLTSATHIVAGGAESSNRNRKLFLFSEGQAPIMTISGDGSNLAAISNPNVDWATGNYPTFGLIYQGRLCAFGSSADRHRIYFSSTSDHEDFNTSSLSFPIFPGEGDGLVSAAVYRGLLFVFKKPYGVYIINGTDPDTANWTVQRYSDSFGVSSPHSIQQVLTDLIAGNSFGSFTSLQATDAYGDFEAGDMLINAQIDDYIRNQFHPSGITSMSSVYYAHKKVALFTGRGDTGSQQNRMLRVDVAKQTPRYSIETKDSPNCLALRKNSLGIPIPMYGGSDGYVYLMDQSVYNVNSNPYTGEFQTAYTDLSFASPEMAGKNKIFDFLDVSYIPTGNNNFYCDVYVDGSLRKTLTFTQVYGAALDDFELDVDTLSGEAAGRRNRKALQSCTGNRISFRFYNNTANEGFKIERIVIGFRLSAEQVYDVQI